MTIVIKVFQYPVHRWLLPVHWDRPQQCLHWCPSAVLPVFGCTWQGRPVFDQTLPIEIVQEAVGYHSSNIVVNQNSSRRRLSSVCRKWLCNSHLGESILLAMFRGLQLSSNWCYGREAAQHADSPPTVWLMTQQCNWRLGGGIPLINVCRSLGRGGGKSSCQLLELENYDCLSSWLYDCQIMKQNALTAFGKKFTICRLFLWSFIPSS